MPDKPRTFLVNISILEGRHYIWCNTNSAVIVQIDKQKKYTTVKFNTDNPYYNEYFVFEFFSTLESFLDKTVTITVIKPGSILRKQKILGVINFDIGIIWNQKDHQIYHKWALLAAASKEWASGTRGYLKLDVAILAHGQHPKIPTIIPSNDIEGNLFLAAGTTTNSQRVNFAFNIYRGQELVKKIPTQNHTKKFESPNTHLEITFSGLSAKTTTKKNSSHPVWNEKLSIPEMFPPPCQRFRFALYHDGTKRATRYLYLRTLSSDKEEGFLPTFGPNFLHFYSPNNLEGYLGKILLSINTTLQVDLPEFEAKINFPMSQASAIKEDFYVNFEPVVVLFTIFDVTMISKKFTDKNISFRVSCGSQMIEEIGDGTNLSVSQPLKPKLMNKYGFLTFEHQKPCLSVTLTLPDIRSRIFNHNFLAKIAFDLKRRLMTIESLYQNKDYHLARLEAEPLIFDTVDFVSSSCTKYLDLAPNYHWDKSSNLEKERLKMSLRDMNKVQSVAKNLSRDQSRRKIFRKLEKILTTIETLIDIIEDWPRIYIWLLYQNKRVAFTIVKARNIIFSPIDEEKGYQCGVPRPIFFHTEQNQAITELTSNVCKMEACLWMSFPRHLKRLQLSGFQFSEEEIPRFCIAQECHTFNVQVYLFQGYIMPGSDSSGLCDPIVNVVFGNGCQTTKVLKNTLTPIWDQTIIFPKITLFGSLDFIQTYPPTIIFEVFDQDEFAKLELVGKCELKVLVQPNPKLSWVQIFGPDCVTGELLTGTELIGISPEEPLIDSKIISIPPEIKPHLVNHRIEVYFWGVRNLKPIHLVQVLRPKIILECGSMQFSSDPLINAKKNPNFSDGVKIFEAILPQETEFLPPLCLKMYDNRSFGIKAFVGTFVAPVAQFLYTPITSLEREKALMEAHVDSENLNLSLDSVMMKLEEAKVQTKPKVKDKIQNLLSRIQRKKAEIEEEEEDTSDFDWWTKFYASLELISSSGKLPLRHKYKLKIYQNELEKQPEFGGFQDCLQSFPFYKGKRTGDQAIDAENTTGLLKGSIKIYQWPLEDHYLTLTGFPLEKGFFQYSPSNVSRRFVLRVYCIRALNLKPKDLNGKSDPYLKLTLSEQVINDRENRIYGQLNPIFGRCFEFNGEFPKDHTVTVAIMDYDATTTDDLIGATKIDLENRYYTKHRAYCGLASDYLTSGYCHWRDQQSPVDILAKNCKRNNLPLSFGPDFVQIASKEIVPENFTNTDDPEFDRQVLALEVLKQWSTMPLVGCVLVPEHVETRSLYHDQKAGMEQGKLQMWIDILPCLDMPTPKQVNIKPRKPISYELRVIIWNCRNIKLDETDLMTGEKKSDVFIKGWVTGPDLAQYTDVHYRCLTGEANFNWRFIFQFDYLASENVIVVKRKTFLKFEEEQKMPARLTLQAWDNDTLSCNDFLGVLNLDLAKLPRGAISAKSSNLEQIKNQTKGTNLFRTRRTKAWYPFKNFDHQNHQEIFVGTIELEFDLLNKEDAEKSPAGLGRDEPQGLLPPKRPESSFSWFKNPLVALKYTLKVFKRKCIRMVIILLLIVVVVFLCYMVWKMGLKKLIGI